MGQSVISPDVVARYAADAAREVDGVTGIVEGVRKGIRVDGGEIVLHLALRWGVSIPAVGAAVQVGVADYLERMTDARPAAVNVVVEEVDGRRRAHGLTKLTLETAPSVCHECVWWQSRGSRRVDKTRWMEQVEDEFGAFGTVYYGDDGRALGVDPVRAGAALPACVRAAGGPPSDDAMLVTCAYLVDESAPVGAAVADPRRDRRGARPRRDRDRGVRLPLGRERVGREGRFRAHRTVFPADFLGDFGFRVVRTSGRVGLARLELGGLAAGRGRQARAGTARREGGVHARAAAGAAALSVVPAVGTG